MHCCRASSLAHALPSYVVVLFGRCFATCVYFKLGGCSSTLADALPLWSCFSVDAFHHFVLHPYSPLASLAIVYPLRASSALSGGLCLSGKIRVSSSFVLLLLSVCSVCGYGHMCVCLYFSSVFLYFFCSLCACVSQALFDYFSFVSLSTAFFLMKNIPRHGPKKKRLSSTII